VAGTLAVPVLIFKEFHIVKRDAVALKPNQPSQIEQLESWQERDSFGLLPVLVGRFVGRFCPSRNAAPKLCADLWSNRFEALIRTPLAHRRMFSLHVAIDQDGLASEYRQSTRRIFLAAIRLVAEEFPATG